jgi:hypothetical protein
MTNHEFIERFESDSLSGEFHHADHMRLAYAYLSEYPLLQAIERFTNALKRYAAAHGQPQRYHETISFAYFFLTHERMARAEARTWDDFRKCNPDLFVWKDGILTRYYHDATLQSDLSRTVFLFPDRMC